MLWKISLWHFRHSRKSFRRSVLSPNKTHFHAYSSAFYSSEQKHILYLRPMQPTRLAWVWFPQHFSKVCKRHQTFIYVLLLFNLENVSNTFIVEIFSKTFLKKNKASIVLYDMAKLKFLPLLLLMKAFQIQLLPCFKGRLAMIIWNSKLNQFAICFPA